MGDLIEAYLSVYEESDVAKRTREAVRHQRKGTYGGDHEMEKESEESTKAVKKATKHRGPKATPSLPESVDLYDVVLDHLLDEGYADTEENAITIMANMSEEWRENILERFVPPNKEKSERINTFLNKSLDHLKLYSKQIDTATQELEDKKNPTYNIGKLLKKTNSLSKRMGSARSALSPRSNIRKFRRDK